MMASAPQKSNGASDIPPDIYQAAVASQLGAQPRAEYRVKTDVVNMVLGILSFLLGFIFVVSGMVEADQATNGSGPAFLLTFGLLGLLIMGSGLFLMLIGVIYKNRRVYVYDYGLLYKGGSKVTVQPMRWDQIEATWYSAIRRTYNGIGRTRHSYRIRRVDGYEVKLNDHFANVTELGEIIHNQVIAVKMPQAIAAYNADQTLSFGPFSVNKQGLTNSSGKFLSWSEIRGISIQNGFIRINQVGKRLSWDARPVGNIPNVFLFTTLVRNILNQKQ